MNNEKQDIPEGSILRNRIAHHSYSDINSVKAKAQYRADVKYDAAEAERADKYADIKAKACADIKSTKDKASVECNAAEAEQKAALKTDYHIEVTAVKTTAECDEATTENGHGRSTSLARGWSLSQLMGGWITSSCDGIENGQPVPHAASSQVSENTFVCNSTLSKLH